MNAYILKAGKMVIMGDSAFLSKGIMLDEQEYKTITDTAVFLRNDSIVIFPSILNIEKGGKIKIDAKSGSYSIKEKKFMLNNQKTFDKDNYQIFSQKLVIDVKDSISRYYNDVILNIEKSGIIIEVDTMQNNDKEGMIFGYYNPLIHSNSGDYEIVSDRFYYDYDNDTLFLFHNVVLTGDSLEIRTDSMIFYNNGENAKSFYRTNSLNKNTKIDSDTLFLMLKDNNIENLFMFGSVLFNDENDDEQNYIECDSLNGVFIENEIRDIEFFKVKKAKIKIKKADKNDTQD